MKKKKVFITFDQQFVEEVQTGASKTVRITGIEKQVRNISFWRQIGLKFEAGNI